VNTRRNVAIDIVKGAIAGAAATWVMGRATTWLYQREREQAKERENEARGGGTAYENAAERLAGALHVSLAQAQRARAGTAIHWATGIASGVAYQLLRRRWAGARTANGLPFGTAVFLVLDEAMNPLLGLTPGPRAFPWQAHARGFAGHLVFGATTEMVLGGLDRVAA
jgi:hypothetical protein